MANETPDDAMAPDIVDEREDIEELVPILMAITLGVDDEDEIISSNISQSETQAELPPRASLMGLPVEIRLLIYEYLLIPSETVVPKNSCSICNHSSNASARGASEGGDHCDSKSSEQCTIAQLYPQVLATCKKIFNEGVPILHDHVWLNITFDTGFVDSWLDFDKPMLPPASHTLICLFPDCAERVSQWHVERFSKRITSVRLSGLSDSTKKKQIRRLFKRLQKLPKLQHIVFSMPDESKNIRNNMYTAMRKSGKNKFRKEYVEKQAMETAKTFSVVNY